MSRYIIGVIGDAHLGAAKWKLAVALGRGLIDANCRIISGGHVIWRHLGVGDLWNRN